MADGLRHQTGQFFGHGGSAVGDPELFLRPGHSSGLCEFMREVVGEFGGQGRDGVFCQPLRSRYHT